MTTIKGGCLCGAVRYTATAEPITIRACWCRVCQYFATGNASLNLVFPREAVAVTGTTTDYASLADSGSHMHRHFCPTCGVQVYSLVDERPQLIILRTGTLDDPALAAPRGTIWTKSAPPWALIDPALPRFEGQPPPPPTPKPGPA